MRNFALLVLSIGISAAVFWLRTPVYGQLSCLEMPVILQRSLFITLLCAPFIYLAVLGSTSDRDREEYYKLFKSIEFKSRDGKYPMFLEKYEDDKKRTIYKFRSGISLGEWKACQERLETVLDCTILNLMNAGSKKIIQITAISSDYKLPSLILWDDSYIVEKESCLAVGESAMGPVSFDLNGTPHVLVAGETGSGKSVILHVCLWQMIMKNARVIMLDFKGGVEFGLDYEQYGEVVTNRERAVEVLDDLVKENSLRLELFRKNRAKNINEYNEKTGSHLCRVGVFCDEIAEMLDTTGVPKEEKEIYEKIKGLMSTLARLSRSTGINLVLGVQRPDAKILTGQIKNNIPIRICGRFADKAASEIVLNSTAATGLPDIKGRFLYLRGNELLEIQAYLFEDHMMHEVSGDKGVMLVELQNGKPEEKFYEQPPIIAQEENHEQETKNKDYGLDRYKNVGDLDLDYSDGLIEWSVDHK